MDEWQQLVSETRRMANELNQFAELVAKLAVDVSIIEGIEEAKRGEDVNGS